MKILDALLTHEQRKAGLNLHNDGVQIYLFRYGSCVKKWDADTVTVKDIQDEAAKQMGDDAVPQLMKCGGIEIRRGK